MKKRLLSALLCLIMLLALLPVSVSADNATEVTVGGVTLDGATGKAYWKNGDTAATGATGTEEDYNAWFDVSTATLTLKNAKITSAYNSTYGYLGINVTSYDEDLTITLVGSNTITVEPNNNTGFGVRTSGNLTINGSGSLTATGGAAAIHGGYVTISDSATVIATGGTTDGDSCGIRGSNSVTISGNATVIATGGTAGGDSYGIDNLKKTGIIVSDAAKVTATGGEAGSSSFGVSSYCATIKGSGSLTATGGSSESSRVSYGSYGLFVSANATIEDGATVTAVGGKGSSSYGISAYEGVSISGDNAKVVAVGGNATTSSSTDGSYGISVGGSVDKRITYNGGLLVAKGGKMAMNRVIYYASGLTVGKDYGSYNSKYFVISPGTATNPTYHVEDSNVYPASLPDGVHGHIDWNDDSPDLGEDLDLTNTIIIGEDDLESTYALQIPAAGTLTLEGFNVILAGDNSPSSSNAVYCQGNLTVKGSGFLTAIAGTSGNSSLAIYANDINSSANITAIGGSGGRESCGIGIQGYESENISASATFSGGVVTAIGGDGGDGGSHGVLYNTINLSDGRGAAICGSATTAQAMSQKPTIGDDIKTFGAYDGKALIWIAKPSIVLMVCDDKIDFPSATVGYKPQAGQNVGVLNVGDEETGALTVTLSGDDAFEVLPEAIASIPVDGEASFTVTPKTELRAGTYKATVTVSGENGIRKSLEVSFTVKEADQPKKEPEGYEVNISVSPGGKVSPSGRILAAGSQRLTITPDPGYIVYDVVVDGVSVKGQLRGGDLVLKNITRAKNVAVTFIYAGDEDLSLANPFEDVSSADWFYDAVMSLYQKGVMTGVSDSYFDPYGKTTRGMIVTMLWRMEGQPVVVGDCPFEDVASGSYCESAVIWAAESGIVEGYSDGGFGPDDEITREQLAAILYRYIQHKGGGFTGMWAFPLDFADASEVSDYAYEPMCYLTMNGIITGDNGYLKPKATATRAEAAAMLQRGQLASNN